MLQMTIKDILIKARQDRRGIRQELYHIYLIQEEETVFYVGKASNPENRLLAHLGFDWHCDPSSIGRFVIDHAPASGTWLFLQYTVEECIPFVDQYRVMLPESSQVLYRMGGDKNRCDVDFAEEALIKIHRPHFNRAMNPNPCPLPEKYRAKEIMGDENPYAAILTKRFGIKRKAR